MSNSIEKGLEFLSRNFGLKPENVEVIKRGQYLYCLFDNITKTFTLPYIANDDLVAQKSLYDIVSEQPNSNLSKYRKTFSLWRICDMQYPNAGKKCMSAICTVDKLIDFFESFKISKEKQKCIDGLFSDDKPLELPEFINKE